MPTHYSRLAPWASLCGLLLLSGQPLRAQFPTWKQASFAGRSTSTTQRTGTSRILATAIDDAGNVVVSGSFEGQVRFGSTVLTSAGGYDIFLAKYLPATGQWAWAERAGGTGTDSGGGLVVSGSSIYLTGSISNSLTDAEAVRFGAGTVQLGASGTVSNDLFVAKYTDTGTGAALNWTQVGGGQGDDHGFRLAVSGASVYVVGGLSNDPTDQNAARFGGSGTTPGTLVQAGTNPSALWDMLVVKYTDLGNSATVNWTQVGGGAGVDQARAVAVSGTSVYVAGTIQNDAADANAVRFGGAGTVAGTVPQLGTGTFGPNQDAVLVKYTDLGSSAAVGWVQAGGGTEDDVANGVAVSGNSVYLTGFVVNNLADDRRVRFGATGTTPGTIPQLGASIYTSRDAFLLKYTDQGSSASLGWTQIGGGWGEDAGEELAVDGPTIYLAGMVTNNTADATQVRFGGSGSTPGTLGCLGATTSPGRDWLLVGYTDLGASGQMSWTLTGGSPANDRGMNLAARNGRVYVGGFILGPASFGPTTLTPLLSVNYAEEAVLAEVSEAVPLAMTGARQTGSLQLYPTVLGADQLLHYADAPTAGGVLEVSSLLGQRVGHYALPAGGRGQVILRGLPAGCYLVRLAGQGSPAQRVFIRH